MRGVAPAAALLFTISNLVCKDAFAQDVEALFNLTFDELLEQQVSISSRDAVALDASPSTVTLFTRQMLDRLAVSNLYDLLNYVPGFQVTRGDWVGAVPKEHARGVYLDNGYVLFMVDGQRVNEVSFGKASVYMPFIPLSIAERVEVIRGPGSALYGSNAFMGVVNLITRKQDNMLVPRIGNRGSQALSVAYFPNWYGLDWQVLLDVDQQGPASHRFNYSQVRDPRHYVFAQLGVQGEIWHLTSRYAKARMNGYINLGGASEDNRYQSENIGIEGGVTWWQGEQGTLTSTVDVSEHRISSAGLLLTAAQSGLANDFFNGPNWVTRNVQFSTDWVKPINDNWELSAGFAWLDTEQTQAGAMTSHLLDGVFLLEDRAYLGGIRSLDQVDEFDALLASQDSRSGYVQLKWQAAADWLVYLGSRVDRVERLSTNWSPRLALIHQVNAQHSVRLQYGEAFRTPTINELFSSDAVTQGNPELQQEKIATLEAIWRWQGEQAQLETVLFQNDMRDFVNKVETQQDSRFSFANTGQHSIQGIESSLNIKFGSHWETQVSYTQLFDEPFNTSFKRYGNLRLGYQDEIFSLNWDLLWRTKVSQDTFVQSAYGLLNFQGRWQWRENQAWTLSVVNLLDKEFQVYEPRLTGLAMPGERRQLMLGYQLLF
ncbi:TonB-dependent receptor plug domain-containing protein [Bowmanella yangjiangensis]|uniref:TonB-dependent receptor n=1 Tax=Bowmanella yangjiangensis TaxID=2811230 RepID=A0ABS3CP70_9ALTE|nr:TonB-dependent receptor [Bowmanella yangjiangensis]MBN7818261.1 TonB-dependent receptor [Bowmanella yangjiangensis]